MNRDQKVAAGLGLFAINFIVASWRLPRFPLTTTVIDSYIYPVALGVVLLGLSAAYFVQSSGRGGLSLAQAKSLFEGANKKLLVGLIAATFVYALILEFLGFILATSVFLLGTMLLLGLRKWLSLVAISIGFSVVVYSVFVYVLHVPLAAGLLPF